MQLVDRQDHAVRRGERRGALERPAQRLGQRVAALDRRALVVRRGMPSKISSRPRCASALACCEAPQLDLVVGQPASWRTAWRTA